MVRDNAPSLHPRPPPSRPSAGGGSRGTGRTGSGLEEPDERVSVWLAAKKRSLFIDPSMPEPHDDLSAEELIPVVYDELRRLAASRLRGGAAGQTLQPTALVHEAWIRLGVKYGGRWESREHFFNAVARTMRRILIDRARQKASLKRGGDPADWQSAGPDGAGEEPDARLLLLDEIVQQLETEDPEGAQIVSLKFFAGLTNSEIADSLGVNVRTIERKWALLKIRLYELAQEFAAGKEGDSKE